VAKILVADDNSNIQKMVGLALKDQGIDVVAVGNGEAAVRKISDIRPDLVLADVFMPVRNGYEVCRYVKEDASLAHIPVILLVGAFDPLDEQEAQRVGADGVLKKPFVPPDPLISMVKSALTRAGVSLGPAPAKDKAPALPKRSTAEILNAGMSSKLAELAPQKLPEASPEPVEEFPTSAPHLKIAAGSEPLAFGSLLDTSDAEDAAVTAKPMIDLSGQGKWDEESDEVEEEKEEAEEKSEGGGWRPGGLDELLKRGPEPSHDAPDWREEAFHGNSPAKSFSSNWAPSIEQHEVVEAAESHSVAIATISKPAEAPAPFTGDAWAAAMAAGVEEKVAEIKDIAPVAREIEAVPEVHEPLAQRVPEGFTQHVSEAAARVEDSPAVQHVSPEPLSEPANWAAVPEAAWEMEAKKASLLASTWDAPKSFAVEETQDIPPYSAGVPAGQAEPAVNQAAGDPSPVIAEPKSWENAWESPKTEAVSAEPQGDGPQAEQSSAVIPAAQPDVDELVAKVLGKLSPEVLQKVTREILKPVIEAIVRDEINSKKS
jgi:CheY-like chemotaxis protein